MIVMGQRCREATRYFWPRNRQELVTDLPPLSTSDQQVRETHYSLERLGKHETLHIITVIILLLRHVVDARKPAVDLGSLGPRDEHLPAFFLPFPITCEAVPGVSAVIGRM